MTTIDTPYEDLLRDVFEHGNHKSDRTGTGTRSVFGRQIRFDLSQGFPLISTKKVHWKSVAIELLWFLRGDSNIGFLQENGVRIWNEWMRPYNLDRPTVLVAKKNATPAPYAGNYSSRGINAPKGTVEYKLAGTWERMMRRCYDPTNHRYATYGAVGITVHPRWHDVRNFIEDARQLPQWRYKSAEWNRFELDKDYYGSSQYGPDTSVWLSTEENNIYTRAAKPVTVTTPDGDETTFVAQAVAARTIGMPTSTLSRFLERTPTVLKGHNKTYIGWEFKEAAVADDQLLRLELIGDGEMGPVYGVQWRSWPTPDGGGVDQIQSVIDTLKTNPDSRRIIVSAWNVAEIHNMALPPCHALFQFYVADGKLSCQLYQRSADMFLGVPFNIASYALLTHLVADQTGLEVGEFIWTGGDTHIYDNHVEQVTEQLSRDPFPLPKLVIKRTPGSIFEYDFDDFDVVGYEHHPAIKGAVAV